VARDDKADTLIVISLRPICERDIHFCIIHYAFSSELLHLHTSITML
jgi:hypothetical protein